MGKSDPPQPVTIRGVEYSSIGTAARALGVSRSTVRRGIREGRLDEVGIPNRPRRAMTVLIRGVKYPSVKAAAKAMGVTPATVYWALSQGDPDKLGLGKGHRPPASRKGGLPRKPVTVAGRRFASIADLARAIGRDPKHVRQSLKRGPEAQERIVLAVMKLIADQENAARRARDRAA